MFKPFRNFIDEKRKKRCVYGVEVYVAKQGHNHAHEFSLFFVGKSSVFIK